MFHVKQKGKFKQIFKSPRLEFCDFMEGKQSANFLLKSLIESLKEKSPESFHKCPYNGHFELVEFSVPKHIISIMPIGLFRVSVIITDDSSKAFLNVSVLVEILNWRRILMALLDLRELISFVMQKIEEIKNNFKILDHFVFKTQIWNFLNTFSNFL